MYGTSDRDLMQALNSMANEALRKNWNNRLAAREDLAEYIANDKRFDRFDTRVLARRYEEMRNCGGVLKLDDPRLKGGPARPLERDQSW